MCWKKVVVVVQGASVSWCHFGVRVQSLRDLPSAQNSISTRGLDEDMKRRRKSWATRHYHSMIDIWPVDVTWITQPPQESPMSHPHTKGVRFWTTLVPTLLQNVFIAATVDRRYCPRHFLPLFRGDHHFEFGAHGYLGASGSILVGRKAHSRLRLLTCGE